MSSNDCQALLNCPFCGGEAEAYYVIDGSFACSCTSCSYASCAGFNTEQEAIAAWNRRAEHTCSIEDVTSGYTETNWGRCSSCGEKFPYQGDVVACPCCGAKVKEER